MKTTCPRCGGRSRDGFLCHSCTRRVRSALKKTGRMWAELEVTITRRDRLGRLTERVTGSSGRPLPFAVDASQTGDAIRATLAGWVRIGMEDFNAPLPHNSAPAFCVALLDHLPEWRKHSAAEDFANEVLAMPAMIHRAIDYPEERSRIKVGPCPAVIDGHPCTDHTGKPSQVVAVFPEDMTARAWMECRTCDWRADARYWDEAGELIRRRIGQVARQVDLQHAIGGHRPTIYDRPSFTPRVLVTIADAALTYGVPERTVRSWLGKTLTKYERRGLTLVDPDEVRRAADSWSLKRNAAAWKSSDQ